jgi:hypothetical protein
MSKYQVETSSTKTLQKLAVFIPVAGMPKVLDLLGEPHGDELETLQFAVDGWVQAISLSQEWKGFTLWSNEEGKMGGFLLNKLATIIWRESFAGYEWGSDDYIMGNAVITLDADEDGETPSMTIEQANELVLALKNHTAA